MPSTSTTGARYQAIAQKGPFETVQVPKPTPGPTEIVVHVKAVALCPLDWKQLLLGLYVEKWPVVFGSDGAGIIDAVGDQVRKFKVGDEVMGNFARGTDRGGSFQEYAVLSEAALAHKPASWTFEDAASLTLGYMTATSGIYSASGLGISLPYLPSGRQEESTLSSILIPGGSSTTGASAIQLLRLALPDVTILTTSSPKHHAHLKSLGADAAFDHASPGLVEDVKGASPGGTGVHAIFDPVNAVAMNTALLGALSPDGPRIFAELITGRNVKSEDVPLGVEHRAVLMANVFGEKGAGDLVFALGELVREGKYKLPVPVTVVGTGWDKIGEGLQRLMGGVSGTKLVVSV